MFHVSEGAASVYAWLKGNFAHERQPDSHPSSSCEVVGLDAEADLVLWSRPRQVPPAVDSMLDPMLVEVAIQAPPQTVAPLQNQDMAT